MSLMSHLHHHFMSQGKLVLGHLGHQELNPSPEFAWRCPEILATGRCLDSQARGQLIKGKMV